MAKDSGRLLVKEGQCIRFEKTVIFMMFFWGISVELDRYTIVFIEACLWTHNFQTIHYSELLYKHSAKRNNAKRCLYNYGRGAFKSYYYMVQVTSGKIARCDWLLTWRDLSVMTAGIMKIVNAL